jgi:hypothetical protein
MAQFFRIAGERPGRNLVAQVLLEKVIAIDQSYGQALGLLAASYISVLTWVGRTWRLLGQPPSVRR